MELNNFGGLTILGVTVLIALLWIVHLGNIDERDPYILVGSTFVKVPEICEYIPQEDSNIDEIIEVNCEKDFTYRNTFQLEEESKLQEMKAMLYDTSFKVQDENFTNVVINSAVHIPSVVQWVTSILKAQRGSVNMISMAVPKHLFDKLTLDENEMLKNLVNVLPRRNFAQMVSYTNSKVSYLDLPKMWEIYQNKFHSTLLKLGSLQLNENFDKNDLNLENEEWNLRKENDKQETIMLKRLTEEASKNFHPLTMLMDEKIKGKKFVFASKFAILGPKIERMFLVTKNMDSYPDLQYLAFSMNISTNLTTGLIQSNKYQHSDKVSCLSSLYLNGNIKENCFVPKQKSQPVEQYDLIVNNTIAVVIKIIVEENIVQFLCPDTVDEIYSYGILIVIISNGCTVKSDQRILKVGTNRFQDSLVNGIHVLYNGKKEQEEKVYNQLKETVYFLEDSYEWGIIVDIIMGAFLAISLILMALNRTCAFFGSRDNQPVHPNSDISPENENGQPKST